MVSRATRWFNGMAPLGVIVLFSLGLASDLVVSQGFKTTVNIRRQDACAQHSDGCSTPTEDFLYKIEFTPSCDRHDMCYACGALLGISRDQCDVYFRDNMLKTCKALRRHSDVLSWKYGSNCTEVAHVYFLAVQLFGASHYSDNSHSNYYCTPALVRACVP